MTTPDPINRINVTRPSLPSLDSLMPHLRAIWESGVLSNGGPYNGQLETMLCKHFQLPAVSTFNNGTSALISAIQSCQLSGEVITTPYSFIATSNALVLNNLEPVFVDVQPDTLNIDPELIEASISERTSAILAVHCYGTPCDTARIAEIARKHKLTVIYDAAHAFGVEDQGGSILRHGDLSVLSFHATKVFNTLEGGAVVSSCAETRLHLESLRNFGFVPDGDVREFSANGKMNEVCAALGLLQLGSYESNRNCREKVDSLYRALLNDISGIDCLVQPEGIKSNYAYFPILVQENFRVTRDQLQQELQQADIYCRPYFSPLISEFSAYRPFYRETPIAKNAARRILCLPQYAGLTESQVQRITDVIKGVSR